MMRKYCLLVTLAACLHLSAEAIQATVDVYQFRSSDGPYAEFFFYVLGSTVTPGDSTTTSVQIKYYVQRDSTVYAGDKYNLVVDDNTGDSDFMDLRRHYLKPGIYSVHVEIRDNQDKEKLTTIKKDLVIEPPVPGFSDIQLLSHFARATLQDKWTRNGVTCIPQAFQYFGPEMDLLGFYVEMYESPELVDSDFYLKFSILPAGDTSNTLLKKHKRMSPAAVSPVLESIDIKGLTSGSYFLRVEAFNRENEMLAGEEIMFTRSNPAADQLLAANSGKYFDNSFTKQMDADSLRYALKAVAPKVSSIQIDALNYLIKNGSETEQRRFLHQFWRNINDDDPGSAYEEYMVIANYANEAFMSGFGYGFETDRGMIYLRYGAPNDVVRVEDEPSAPPYEIWIYYKFPLTGQNNVKFLFYAPELANSFELLHSTCENEINNPAWEQMLYKDALSETSSGDLIDARPVQGNFNRRAKEYFTDF